MMQVVYMLKTIREVNFRHKFDFLFIFPVLAFNLPVTGMHAPFFNTSGTYFIKLLKID